MNRKDKGIMALVVVVICLTLLICFGIVPMAREKKKQQEAAYLVQQCDALTHDITAVDPYKNPYMGDASNMGHLLGNLPLAYGWNGFEMDSEVCTVKVRLQQMVPEQGQQKLHRDLLYSAIAAMGAIDNLQGIEFAFPDESFVFDRTQVETILGESVSYLLQAPEIWETLVQDRLADTDFVDAFYPQL